MAKKSTGKVIAKSAIPKQAQKPAFDDFVATIDSDSDNEIPDLDVSDDEEEREGEAEPVEEIKPVTKKNNKKNKNKKGKKDKVQSEDEDEEQISKDLNPNFVFSLEGMETTSNFDGWDFQMDSNENDVGADVKRDVDLDMILRRKGGLANIAKTVKEVEEEEAEAAVENNEDEDEDEDELAMDGFGMGSSANKEHEEGSDDEEEDEDDEDEEEEEEEEEEGSDTEVELNMKGDKSKLANEEPEDTAEQIAEFYADDEDESTQATKQVHKTFQTLSLSRPVLKGLAQLGYTKPSPIQSASIPVALLGKDIVAGAVTGSGKTAAYIIPIIERLLYKPAKIASTRVVVLAPTRELAIQVADVGKKIGHFVNGLTFGLAVGGLNLRQQEQELKTRPDIVIATPGRFIDHIRNSPSFNVDSVEVLVVDEADRMLEEGFAQELTEILELLPRKRQTLLYSATMNSKIKQLIQLSLDKPVRIMINPPKQSATGLVQEFVRIRKRDNLKSSLLFNLLKKIDSRQQNRVVVFVSRKEMAHRLRIILGLLGIKVSELHGSLSQEQRLKNVTDFKKLTVPVLICTDLAARGLDIPKIEYVINFDMPKSFEVYLHRVGRTARAGREGKSISFVGEASQDRAIVKEAIKSVEANKTGKAVGRNVDWKEVEEINAHIESKKEIIEEVLDEEKHEKEILQAEMQLKKGENLLKYKDEINARPKRTWFQTEAEKKQTSNGLMISDKRKKLNSKRRKVAEERSDTPRSYTKTSGDRKKDQENTIARKTKANSKKNKKGKKKPFAK